jgi:hypothetical protein
VRGGKREGAGRPAGARNQLTAAQKRTLGQIAGDYTEQAIQTLADIMVDSTVSAAARVTAATSILDRGHGRPVQAAQPTDNPPIDWSVLADDEVEAVATGLRILQKAYDRQSGAAPIGLSGSRSEAAGGRRYALPAPE